ncbi:MAG: GNAT family N-acetyltransferase [Pseudomonadota bacterium]
MLTLPKTGTTWLETRSGFLFLVRTADTQDEALLAEFFEAVSLDDLRFRFLTAIDHVGHTRLQSLLDVDHQRTESFLAFDDGGRVIATAMLACDAAMDVGEVAISIRSDHKGRGIGWTLLEYVADQARQRGVKRLQAVESRDNHSAVELEREMGFHVVPNDDDPSVVVLEIAF